MRWMTYSVSKVFEPVDKKKETHLCKSTREEVGVQLVSSAAQELKHTHMQSLNMYSEYHRQTTLSGEFYID